MEKLLVTPFHTSCERKGKCKIVTWKENALVFYTNTHEVMYARSHIIHLFSH